ncbi:LytS/YhcK type 5TM receptor domain-containing protein [Bombilactobacillus bombi]|uniref:LytS/YhcK type 5TM receptor domain-containing protein n=1 Tax=Bombilactobacillus bombi TaxID=1303590 RepID=UPI0015E5E5D0|nr:LytS/YhcK type 5TM receptor domain-containing protein [Bombilactobacillus bombi]MBA1433755.1 sensor protein LytS [Bombilactobacillus bombi]
MTVVFNLLILLAERLGFIMILAFLLVNTSFFRNLIKSRNSKAQIWLTLIFSIFVIISNLTGVEITNSKEVVMPTIITNLSQSYSIANTRTLVITTASLTAGPGVGMVVGLVGGLHRFIFSNFSDSFYIVSSVLIGFLVGKIGDQVRGKQLYPSIFWVGILGLGAEFIQMAFICIFRGFDLVKLVIVPMAFLNTVGSCLFIEILKTYMSNERQLRAVQTKDVLELTNKTLPYFRKGLDVDSAHHVCEIIKTYTNFDAVGITDKVNVLAHVGAGADHHIANEPVLTDLSKTVILTGKRRLAHCKAEIGCPHPHCPLAAAIVIPLQVNQQTIGALKVYFTDPEKLTVVEENLVAGLATIFSGQLAIGIAEEQTSLITEAEIKALQVQISPHFFFNALNTIAALMRVDIDKARTAVMQLSIFFRSSLQNGQEKEVTLQQEKKHVDAYMNLENLRFPNRFQLQYHVEVSSKVLIPAFCLQIFVENAVRHAFKGQKNNNQILVEIVPYDDDYFQIKVSDNGQGIKQQIQTQILKEPIIESHGTGTALYNLNRRFLGLYGSISQIKITTSAKGTSFIVLIPWQLSKEEIDL